MYKKVTNRLICTNVNLRWETFWDDVSLRPNVIQRIVINCAESQRCDDTTDIVKNVETLTL